MALETGCGVLPEWLWELVSGCFQQLGTKADFKRIQDVKMYAVSLMKEAFVDYISEDGKSKPMKFNNAVKMKIGRLQEGAARDAAAAREAADREAAAEASRGGLFSRMLG